MSEGKEGVDETPRGFSWVRSLARSLGPVLRPHTLQLSFVLGLMLLELGLQMAQRKAFSTLIDEAILQTQFGLMALILGLMLAASLVSGAAGLLHEFLQSRLCAVVPAEVRARLFLHVQGMPLSHLRTSTHGDLISRIINDASSVEPALWSLGYIATAACGVVIAMGMLLWTEWRLALLGIGLLLPLTPIGARILTPLAARESYASKTAYGALSSHLQENLANQVVLRVFGLGQRARDRFAEQNARIVTHTRRYNIFSYYSHRVPWIAIELIDVLVLAAGCWMVVRGDMSTGSLVAFYLLFSALATHTYSLITSFSGLISASAGMRRVGEIMRLPSTLPAAQSAGHAATGGARTPPAIDFDAVSFRYSAPGDSPSGTGDAALADQLREVSFSVPSGRMTAFVGESGSGKSTAVQLLLGLHRPRTGQVHVDGLDLAGIPQADYWAGTAAVFQDSLLFHASIAENIRAGRLQASDDEIAAAARGAGIADWIATLPEGYDTPVSGDTCSGGQRQRIAIARALVRQPALLVLDEPTSALDASTGRAVMQTLLTLSEGRTCVLVTHQLRDAAHAARIIVFAGGRAVESGTHEDLLAAGGTYATLWEQQERRLSLAPQSA